jgi:hypothetical protein
MLGTSAVLVGFLWYRLGGSADYHDTQAIPVVEDRTAAGATAERTASLAEREPAELEDNIRNKV